jgi:hypothetical protein
MKHRTKLAQSQNQAEEQHSHAQSARQFSNSDELLRFDAAQTTVPAAVAQRLKKSAAQMRPAESRPWWKQLFNR